MHYLMGQRHVNNANKCGHPGESTPHLNSAQSPFDLLLLRVCLFGLAAAGCAAVYRKLLYRESCCFKFYCLAI
jgi:hypothetical protein